MSLAQGFSSCLGSATPFRADIQHSVQSTEVEAGRGRDVWRSHTRAAAGRAASRMQCLLEYKPAEIQDY